MRYFLGKIGPYTISIVLHIVFISLVLGLESSHLSLEEPLDIEVIEEGILPPSIESKESEESEESNEEPESKVPLPSKKVLSPRPSDKVPSQSEPSLSSEPEPEEPLIFDMSNESFVQDGSWVLSAGPGDSPFGVPKLKSRKKEERHVSRSSINKRAKSGFNPYPRDKISKFPEVIHEVRAKYPEKARWAGIQGTVKALLGINEKGEVVKVRIISGPGYGLNEAAKNALKRFKFRPALDLKGKPVDYQIIYTYVFELFE
jgi:protein TonB